MRILLIVLMTVLLSLQAVAFTVAAPFVVSDIQSPVIERRVSTLADLKAITGSSTVLAVELMGRVSEGDGGGGTFRWLAGDQSANPDVVADTLEGIYVKLTSPSDGSTGVWVRRYDGAVNVKWFGAAGDGLIDDSAAINAALSTGGEINFPKANYAIGITDVITGDLLVVKSNSVLNFNGSTLTQIATASQSYGILSLDEVANVRINNVTIVGDRLIHTGSAGEWGHGINVKGSTRIVINNANVSNCWGDGVYIGSDGADTGTISESIYITNSVISNSRRNDCSVTHADGVYIDNCDFINANGTAPQAGLCLEPNTGDTVDNVFVSSSRFTGNASHGVLVTNANGPINSVFFIDCITSGNGDIGFFAGMDTQLTLNNCLTADNGSRGLWTQSVDGMVVSGTNILNNNVGSVASQLGDMYVQGCSNVKILGTTVKLRAISTTAVIAYFLNSTNVTVDSATMHGNATIIADGVNVVNNSGDFKITNSIITEVGAGGIEVDSLTDRASILNNTISGVSRGTNFANNYIQLSCANPIVNGNTCVSSGGNSALYALRLLSNASNSVAVGNIFQGYGGGVAIKEEVGVTGGIFASNKQIP